MVKGFQRPVFRLEAITIHAIIKHQELGMQGGVIPYRLLQGALRQLYGRRFAFHDHQGVTIPPEYHRIATSVQSIDLDGILHSQQSRRHAKMLHQQIKRFLSHLLFWSERAITSSQRIENKRLVALSLRLEPLEIRHRPSYSSSNLMLYSRDCT